MALVNVFSQMVLFKNLLLISLKKNTILTKGSMVQNQRSMQDDLHRRVQVHALRIDTFYPAFHQYHKTFYRHEHQQNKLMCLSQAWILSLKLKI